MAINIIPQFTRRSNFWRWGILLLGWMLLAFVGLQLHTGPLGGGPSHAGGRGLLQVIPPTPTAMPLMEPKIDKRPPPSNDVLAEEIANRLPSLPIAYWEKNKNKQYQKFYKNNTCAMFPTIFDLEFDNIYWQTLKTTNGTFHFYGAYYDNRPLNRLGPTVRILTMINRIEPSVVTHCQFWFDHQNEPVIAKSREYKYIWYKKWGNYKQGIFQPYLIACVVPDSHKKFVPASISLVAKPCDTATNNLRVIYDKPPEKKKVAVCVKGLDFLHEDLSVRLVEWLELLNLLGADKVFFYQLQVHPNITKVLDYYIQNGRVSVTPLTLPGGQPNIPTFQHMYLKRKLNHKRQNELVPYNDCLYKNLYTYDYIALLDIDEVIMPIKDNNWQQLLERVVPLANTTRNPKASYNVRNVYFLDDLQHAHGWFKDIPQYMHMLQHVYRAKNFTKPFQYVKSFHDVSRILTVHNHLPLACLGSTCYSYSIQTTDAQLQHYRADCVSTLKKSCHEFKREAVMDTTIWKYKDVLISRVTDTLKKLGFFDQTDS